jgi:ABC-type spermidine/putrescine transport system permease subunit II
LCGLSWPRILLRVLTPQTAGGIATGWILALVFCMNESSLSWLLYYPGWETLPMRFSSLLHNLSDREVSALCLAHVCTTLTLVAACVVIAGGIARIRSRRCEGKG